MPIIACENVSLGYDGKVVVADLSFSLNAGEYLCIVGENGSGKTTLMKTLLGLKNPMSGQIHIQEELKRGGIGYLPQQTAAQRNFPATVREIVLSGCLKQGSFRPFYTKEQKEWAAENLAKLSLSPLADRCFRELSGGQQRRVLLARALCAAQGVILLDEPAAGLDPRAIQEMYEVIGRLNREGMTVLMISHDPGAAVRLASHVLDLGQHPLFFGTAGEYRAHLSKIREELYA